MPSYGCVCVSLCDYVAICMFESESQYICCVQLVLNLPPSLPYLRWQLLSADDMALDGKVISVCDRRDSCKMARK